MSIVQKILIVEKFNSTFYVTIFGLRTAIFNNFFSMSKILHIRKIQIKWTVSDHRKNCNIDYNFKMINVEVYNLIK